MKRTLTYLIVILFSKTTFGQTWANIGSGLNHNCYDFAKHQSDIYAATRDGVFYWNNSTWTGLPLVFGIAYPLAVADYNDTVYVGGDFPFSGSISKVFKYNGTTWVQAGGQFNNSDWSSTKVLCNFNNKLISGGRFTTVGTTTIKNVAAYDGVKWDSLGKGLSDNVYGLCVHNANLIASGDFKKSGTDSTLRYVAQWNGSSWQAISPSHVFKKPGVKPITSFNNQLIIGNVWDTISSQPMKGVAAWNGTTFTSMGNNLLAGVNSFWVYNNTLFCSASIYGFNPNDNDDVVLRWNGFFWQQLGGIFDNVVLTLDDYNGELFCGGFYNNCGGNPLARAGRITVPIGIEELANENSFVFYPNPAKNTLTILCTTKNKMDIVDNLAQTILSLQNDLGKNQIDLGNLKTGIYFLKISDDNNTRTSKLVIE